MSSSQLTFTFSEGLKPPTSHVLFEIYKFTVSSFSDPSISSRIRVHCTTSVISSRFDPVSRLTAWWHVAVENGAMGRVFPTPCRSQRQDPQGRASKFGTQPVSSNMAMDAMDKPHMRFEWGNHQWGMFHCHVWLQEGKSSSSNWKGLFYLQRWP